MGAGSTIRWQGIPFLVLLWLLAVAAGSWALERYKAAAGAAKPISLQIVPAEHPLAESSQDFPRLVMFLHPHCPCSRSSLTELKEILTRSPAVTAEIVLVKPPGTPDGWEDTSLRRAAALLPHTQLTVDDGTRAQKLGAESSGHVVLFDPRGTACFSGGIPRSRGHAGESCGRRSILAILRGDVPEASTTSVFGCPLLAADSCVSGGKCCEKSKDGSLQ